jgi:hypothetical protein
MAQTSALVRHAILALSATYIMDFQTSPELESRAQYHYDMAVNLLGQEINTLDNYNPGKGDAMVAALMLMSHNDVCFD